MSDQIPLPIEYQLMVQCSRPEVGVIAHFVASSAFPEIRDGEFLELLDCDPTVWDVHNKSTRIMREPDKIVVLTLLLVDSPVLDNSDRRDLPDRGVKKAG